MPVSKMVRCLIASMVGRQERGLMGAGLVRDWFAGVRGAGVGLRRAAVWGRAGRVVCVRGCVPGGGRLGVRGGVVVGVVGVLAPGAGEGDEAAYDVGGESGGAGDVPQGGVVVVGVAGVR